VVLLLLSAVTVAAVGLTPAIYPNGLTCAKPASLLLRRRLPLPCAVRLLLRRWTRLSVMPAERAMHV
jgi:hypothetical protein